MSRSLGIPVKLLHQTAGHLVTVELKTDEMYRDSLLECKDNWNCQLGNITFTDFVNKKQTVYVTGQRVPFIIVINTWDEKVSQFEHIFIRGSRVRYAQECPDVRALGSKD